MLRTMSIVGLAVSLLGTAPALAQSEPLCSKQVCESEGHCYSVASPCDWPCGDFGELALRADRGALSARELACVDTAFDLVSSTAARDPFHTLLVANAAGRADWAEWRRLSIRYLEVAGAPAIVCEDRDRMMRRAAVGQLSPAEIACLETTRGASLSNDDRRVSSKLLIANASRHFDRATWHQIVHEHLRQVDAHDLDVAFDYQRGLMRSPDGVVDGLLDWVQTELPRSAGGSDTRGLYVIRGMVDLARIDRAARDVDRERTGSASADYELARAEAGQRMAEWLDFDRGLGIEPSTSLGACLATGAAGCCSRDGLHDHPSCHWQGYDPADAPLSARSRACTGDDPQPAALLGQLTVENRGCLAVQMAVTGVPAERKHLSRVLMTDAWSGGDAHRWADLAQSHLRHVDPRDGSVAYELASWMMQQDEPDTARVLQLAELALNTPQVRTGPNGSRKIEDLHRLRSHASASLWSDAERVRESNPRVETRRYAELLRERAAKHAAAWVRVSEQLELDADEARLLCQAAGGECEAR